MKAVSGLLEAKDTVIKDMWGLLRAYYEPKHGKEQVGDAMQGITLDFANHLAQTQAKASFEAGVIEGKRRSR